MWQHAGKLPPGKLWLNLEEVRTGKSTDDMDLFECLSLVEQCVTLLGQANVSLTYARRLGILGRLTGDAKKPKSRLASMSLVWLNPRKVCLGKRCTKLCALQPRFANLPRKYLLTCQALQGLVMPLLRVQPLPGKGLPSGYQNFPSALSRGSPISR